ncbi:unnamed protein product [Caenorhabditis auriculariae]|uniref:C-type lectin domain-containing protein n=1 Tax=Caenorhabditis auriculariae TaxID=2777116 RepID=A0A8S1GYY1_9PELO|nr:unnamed protein product [Caenorhabditis auriculariae]
MHGKTSNTKQHTKIKERLPYEFLLGFLCFIALCNAYESSGEEDLPHKKIHLFNWNHHDLDTLAFDPMGAAARNSIGVTDEDHCPDGWIRFSKSCYYIEQEMMGFAKAEKRCFEKDATLFVANSLDEWDAIRHHTPKAFFAWIGLVRFSSYEKSEALPRWQTEGGINPAKLNWVIRPYSPMPNGWSSVSNCAASYNAAVAIDSASYVYYYPCVSSFHSICERNATLIDLARNNAQFV